MKSTQKIISIIAFIFIIETPLYSATLRVPLSHSSWNNKKSTARSKEVSSGAGGFLKIEDSVFGKDCFNLVLEKWVLLKLLQCKTLKELKEVHKPHYKTLDNIINVRLKDNVRLRNFVSITKRTNGLKFIIDDIYLDVEKTREILDTYYKGITIKHIKALDYYMLLQAFNKVVLSEIKREGGDPRKDFKGKAGVYKSRMTYSFHRPYVPKKPHLSISAILTNLKEKKLWHLLFYRYNANEGKKLKELIVAHEALCKSIIDAYFKYKRTDPTVEFSWDEERLIDFIEQGREDASGTAESIQSSEILTTISSDIPLKPSVQPPGGPLIVKQPSEREKLTEGQIKKIIIQSAYKKLEEWIKLKDWPGAALAALIIKELDPENEVIKGIEGRIKNEPTLKKDILNWGRITEVDRHLLREVVAKIGYYNNKNISLRDLMKIFYLRDVIKKEVSYKRHVETYIPEYINQPGSGEKVQWLSAAILSAISDRNVIEHIEGRRDSTTSLGRVSMREEGLQIDKGMIPDEEGYSFEKKGKEYIEPPVSKKPRVGRPPRPVRVLEPAKKIPIPVAEKLSPMSKVVEIKMPYNLVTWSELERAIILETLNIFKNHRTHAADALGIVVRTLRNKLGEYDKSKEPLNKDLSVRLPPQGARLEEIEKTYLATSYMLAKERSWTQSYLAEKVLGVAGKTLRNKGIVKDYMAIIKEYGERISIQLLDEDKLNSEERALFSKLQEVLKKPILRQERYLMEMSKTPEDVQAARGILVKSSLMAFDNSENSKEVLRLIELIRIILDRQVITDQGLRRKILGTAN